MVEDCLTGALDGDLEGEALSGNFMGAVTSDYMPCGRRTIEGRCRSLLGCVAVCLGWEPVMA